MNIIRTAILLACAAACGRDRKCDPAPVEADTLPAARTDTVRTTPTVTDSAPGLAAPRGA
jgi:hypothetical protein